MGTSSNSNLGDHMRDKRRTWATRSFSQLSTESNLLLLWSCDYLCCLLPFGGPTSPSSRASWCLFLLSSGMSFSPRPVGSWGGGGGGFTGGLDLLASWGEGALFLAFMSSLNEGAGVWTHEYSSVSSSASDITMTSTCVSPSSNQNLSISSSSKEEDAVPSSITACPRAETRLYELNDSHLPW